MEARFARHYDVPLQLSSGVRRISVESKRMECSLRGARESYQARHESARWGVRGGGPCEAGPLGAPARSRATPPSFGSLPRGALRAVRATSLATPHEGRASLLTSAEAVGRNIEARCARHYDMQPAA